MFSCQNSTFSYTKEEEKIKLKLFNIMHVGAWGGIAHLGRIQVVIDLIPFRFHLFQHFNHSCLALCQANFLNQPTYLCNLQLMEIMCFIWHYYYVVIMCINWLHAASLSLLKWHKLVGDKKEKQLSLINSGNCKLLNNKG